MPGVVQLACMAQRQGARKNTSVLTRKYGICVSYAQRAQETIVRDDQRVRSVPGKKESKRSLPGSRLPWKTRGRPYRCGEFVGAGTLLSCEST